MTAALYLKCYKTTGSKIPTLLMCLMGPTDTESAQDPEFGDTPLWIAGPEFPTHFSRLSALSSETFPLLTPVKIL